MRRKYLPGFKEALEWLDDNYGFFLTPVLNMGYPEVDMECDSAYVTLDVKAEGGFVFRVNPEFTGNCSTEELAGVLAHETMHVLLGHMRLVENYTDPKRFNIAADVIINDYLYDAGFQLPDGVLRGESVVGYDCALADLADVYHAIKMPEKQQGSSQDEKSPQGSAPAGGGQGSNSSDGGQGEQPGADETHESCGFSERIREAIEAARNAGEDIEKALKEGAKDVQDNVGALMPADLDQAAQKTGLAAGSGFFTEDEYASENGMTLNWAKLLSEVEPDILKKPGKLRTPEQTSWHAPRRKLVSYYPKIVLPTTKVKEEEPKKKRGDSKPMLVLALDCSGSIPRDMVNKMTRLARSVPEDLIEIQVCTFSTYYVPFDPQAAHNKTASGGTDFSAVEHYVRKISKGKYPKAVIVITDGEAQFYSVKPKNEELKNWTWLMTYNSYRTQHLEQMSGKERVKALKDFI